MASYGEMTKEELYAFLDPLSRSPRMKLVHGAHTKSVCAQQSRIVLVRLSANSVMAYHMPAPPIPHIVVAIHDEALLWISAPRVGHHPRNLNLQLCRCDVNGLGLPQEANCYIPTYMYLMQVCTVSYYLTAYREPSSRIGRYAQSWHSDHAPYYLIWRPTSPRYEYKDLSPLWPPRASRRILSSSVGV